MSASAASAKWNMKNNYRRVVFTVNLPDDKTWEDFDIAMVRVELNTSYFIAGKETGKEGRKHFQGYFEFPEGHRKKGASIDKIFRKRFPLPISCHFESAFGTAAQCIEYCTKEDKEAYIHGEPEGSRQGKRNDLGEILQSIKNGANMVDLAEQNPQQWVQYRKAFEEYKQMVAPRRDWPTQLVFITGPTGTGKTMHAQELKPTPVFWVSDNYLNGYHGEEVILFDDFNYKKMSWEHFLVMTDRYAHTVNIKGGSMNFAPKTIIFTSNEHPKNWYPDAPAETRKAIHRRMDEYGDIIELNVFRPKEETLLDKYFRGYTCAATSAPAVAPAATPASPELVSIPASDEEEEPPRMKRTRSHFPESDEEDEEEDDDDDASQHSDYSNRKKGRRSAGF